jgi:hypothetical protein
LYGLPTSTKYECMGSALILHGCNLTSLLLNDVYIATQDTLVTDHQTQTFHAFISPTAIQSRFLQVDGRKVGEARTRTRTAADAPPFRIRAIAPNRSPEKLYSYLDRAG